ncbi:hypothetical protein SIN8267_01220 [Sinobacterium norvegicum]|uniref:Metal-binding protein n=1 Tax=Sinobacterium norvegicum TaxID=1641715 RepID=A0ABN8EIX5_9GAMM|nr:YecH family metal-binding protein [Sinobacterium norvegicum]CAH0991119.1 hypothetical protein SIN8267_01220 [Sinobacterium norvegicum]
MSESHHVHNVLNMMIDSGEEYTNDSLLADVAQRFGGDAVFHSCKKHNMSAAEMISFLAGRDKFISTDNGFKADAKKVCQH